MARRVAMLDGKLRWHRFSVGLLSACAAGWPAAALCQVYVGVEQSGAIVLSNFASPAATRLLLPGAESAPVRTSPPPVSAGSQKGAVGPRASAEIATLIDSIARRTEMSPQLLNAVVKAESGYDVHAVSSRGALGLMQLMPATAKRFGAADPFSASDNIAAGAGYLKWLMSTFDDDIELVLAAYNAGEQAVIGAGRRIPPYPETQAYVRKIMAELGRVVPEDR